MADADSDLVTPKAQAQAQAQAKPPTVPLTSTSVKFTPLYGTFDASGRGVGPVCSLLEVGGVCILLDCGWDIGFDTALLESLREVVPKVDLVLLSQCDLEHLGGLPYAVGELGLSAPVFATLPTMKMGQMTLYDAHQVRVNEGGGEDAMPFKLDDVDAAFDLFRTLKFSQHLKMGEGGRGSGIIITPLPAGRLIGGSIWRICWQTDDNDIIYAMCFNHRKEELLNGGSLDTISRPSIMITDAHNALSTQAPRKQRVTELIDAVMATMRRGGNVLMPTDTAGRTLELLLILNNHWIKNRLGSYKLVLLHSMAFNVVEFAKSQLEYMSDSISRQFDLQRSNPFVLKYVHIIHTMEELAALGDQPKVVLTTDVSLDYGFSKALLLQWSADPNNLILITNRGHGDTTTREILLDLRKRQAAAAGAGAASTGAVVVVTQAEMQGEVMKLGVDVPLRVALQGEELVAYQEEEVRRRRQQAEEEERKRQEEEMKRGQVLADSDDEGAGGKVSSRADDKPLASRKRRRAINVSLYHKFSKPLNLMFGYTDPVVDTDDYGIREEEPIGWLAVSMQQQNDMGAMAEEELKEKEAALQQLTELSGMNALSGDGGGASSILNAELAFYQDPGLVPTKVVSEERLIEVRARRAYIDMEGLSDGRSIRNLISTIGPRQLVVVGGSSKAVDTLAQYVKQSEAAQLMVVPKQGEEVPLSLDTDVLDVMLHDSLFSKLKWHSIRGYQLASVEGVVESGTDGAPVLRAPSSDEQTGHPAVFASFGDVQLTQLSTALRRAGMSTVFANARVTVNDKIVLTKDKDGRLSIDGPLGDDFYAVRTIVYKQFTVL
jgi:cleavage and polyadenylation specificity factor subunit 2